MGFRTTPAAQRAEMAEKDESWNELHAETYRAHNLRYPPNFEVVYSPEEREELAKLTDRAAEVVCFFDQHLGRVGASDPEEVVDISQSINRAPRVQGGTTCMVPRGLPWLCKRFRLMFANECLAAQGIPLMPFDVSVGFNRQELMCLAGNAFNAHTALAFTLAALACFPKAHL